MTKAGERGAGKGRAPRSGPGSWLAIGLVLLATLAMVLPFLYMLATALTGEWEAFRYPPVLIPARAHLENFPAALTALPFDRFFLNSAILAACVVVGQLFTSATAAYAFARLRFPGRDRLFLCFLSVLLVPALVLLVPRFLIVNALGWVDSYAGLISTELVSVWGIFLLRQFFRTIPRELEGAARRRGGMDDLPACRLAALQAGARDARRRRLRGPVEELSLAARDRPLHGNAGRGSGPGESPRVVLRQLAVPDGGRGDRDRTPVAAVPRRAAVLRSGDRDDGRDLAPQALAWGRSFERDFPADVAAFRV